MKIGKWKSIFPSWKEVEAHNCRINRSLRMGSGWLMDTHDSIKKTLKNLNKADETSINIMKCSVIHLSLFPFVVEKTCFFQRTILKKRYVEVNRCGNFPIWK